MVGELVCMGGECAVPLRVAQLAILALLCVLFTQSAIDKITDWSGNIEWLTGHFSETPFRGVVKPLVGTITIFELSTGASCAIGAVTLWLTGERELALLGTTLAALTLLQLFAGQRIAKDYDGAAQIAPYFLIAVSGILLMSFG